VTGSGDTLVAGGNCAALTGAATVAASGGYGTYTYAWTYVSGTAATPTSPSNASTTFTRTAAAGPSGGDSIRVYNGEYRCTVTDVVSGLTTTVDVTVQTTHIYLA
jgi:hypothetical protein